MSPGNIKTKLKDNIQAAHHSLKPTITEEEVEVLARENAAIKIQRAWRARKRASYLGTDFLWKDLVTHARFQVDRDAATQGKNTARQRWRRAIFLALRLQDGNTMLADERMQYADASRKYLETQHWLEMIDAKHRYGANLKVRMVEFLTSGKTIDHLLHSTTTNDGSKMTQRTTFFNGGLDHGSGKELSLKECPREQLEKERIAYLSPAQRLNYLVQIDSEGKLRWAKTGELVDTTIGAWKDSGKGKGIVPMTQTDDPILQHRTNFVMPAHGLAHSDSSPCEDDAAAGQMHYYLGPRPTGSRIKAWLWRNLTPRGLLERLLRSTIQKNTWIYVSDKHFNIFIGIKTPGTFQHSSFLGGGLVTSAGLISVKDGAIHKLSPLSGHYRTSIQHFRYFLRILEERGVDMHKVEISKAEAALWGIEHIAKIKNKQARLIRKGRTKAKHAVGTVRKPLSRRSQDSGKAESKRKSKEEQCNIQADIRSSTTRSREATHLAQADAPNDTSNVEKPLPDEHTDFPIGTSNSDMKLGA